MQGQCVVAVYGSRERAEQACQALVQAGMPQDHLRISDTDRRGGAASVGDVTYESSGSVWDWLFGSQVPEEDRHAYETGLAGGRTAVSVFVDGAPPIADASAVDDILERYDPIDLRLEDEGAEPSSGPASETRQGERVIPLPEEQLNVGKRATDQVRHVRTYVVEEPVNEDVSLHNERVTIEKRPATTRATGGPAEREYEIREHHEEPMVEKATRAGEELVVRKESDDRTERVHDTVRKTKVDIKDGQR